MLEGVLEMTCRNSQISKAMNHREIIFWVFYGTSHTIYSFDRFLQNKCSVLNRIVYEQKNVRYTVQVLVTWFEL